MTVSPPIVVNVGSQRPGRATSNRMGLADADVMLVTGPSRPVRGFDVRTGKERWTFDPGEKITARLTPAHDGHVLVSWNRGLAMLRIADGHVLWRRDFGDTVSVSLIRIAGRQILCFINKRVQRANIRTTVLLDRDTGKTVFEFARPGNQAIFVQQRDH